MRAALAVGFGLVGASLVGAGLQGSTVPNEWIPYLIGVGVVLMLLAAGLSWQTIQDKRVERTERAMRPRIQGNRNAQATASLAGDHNVQTTVGGDYIVNPPASTTRPAAEVVLRSVGNLATEGCVRWFHLEAVTTGPAIAAAARVTIVPPDSALDEEWQWSGGHPTVDIRSQGARIPLLIGVLTDPCYLAVGWPLTRGEWHVTPLGQTLVGRRVATFSPRARHQFHVTVTWDEGGTERRITDAFELRFGSSVDSEPSLARAGDRPTLADQMPILASLRDRGVQLRNQGMRITSMQTYVLWKRVVEGWTTETRDVIAAVSIKDANFWFTLDTYRPEQFSGVQLLSEDHLLELRVLHEHIQRLARFMREGAL